MEDKMTKMGDKKEICGTCKIRAVQHFFTPNVGYLHTP